MLKEFTGVRQERDHDGYRRWFTDEEMELIVWYTPRSVIKGFQLCYDRKGFQHALTWTADHGHAHTAILEDDPGAAGGIKGTPLLVADGDYPLTRIMKSFQRKARALEASLRGLVAEKIRSYPDSANARWLRKLSGK